MTHVIFFEKPGCANNRRQKAWLEAAGHQVEARDLLSHPWSRGELLTFFGNLPVRDWFNRAAPAVKSGEVVPEQLDAERAMALLLETPLLIRRPLLIAGDQRRVGFDLDAIHAWLGLPQDVVAAHTKTAVEACLHPQKGTCDPKE